jgi:Rrf2 family protein
MLSNKAKYGLKAMLHLAEREGQGGQLAADIAAERNIPKKFLDAILLELKNHNLLLSKKGRGGGYVLSQPAKAIQVGQVVRVLDGPLALLPCASATQFKPCTDCTDVEECRIRWVMRRARDAVADVLDNTSLKDLIAPAPSSSILYYDI